MGARLKSKVSSPRMLTAWLENDPLSFWPSLRCRLGDGVLPGLRLRRLPALQPDWFRLPGVLLVSPAGGPRSRLEQKAVSFRSRGFRRCGVTSRPVDRKLSASSSRSAEPIDAICRLQSQSHRESQQRRRHKMADLLGGLRSLQSGGVLL